MSDPKDHILNLIRENPDTPLGLVWKIERNELRPRNTRSVLLELMCDGCVRLGVDGYLYVVDQSE